MSSYEQLSNRGTLLLGAGASVSADKQPTMQSAQDRVATTAARYHSLLPEGGAGAGGAGAEGAGAGRAAGSQSTLTYSVCGILRCGRKPFLWSLSLLSFVQSFYVLHCCFETL